MRSKELYIDVKVKKTFHSATTNQTSHNSDSSCVQIEQLGKIQIS